MRIPFAERAVEPEAMDNAWDIETEPCSSENSGDEPAREETNAGIKVDGDNDEGDREDTDEGSDKENMQGARTRGVEDSKDQGKKCSFRKGRPLIYV